MILICYLLAFEFKLLKEQSPTLLLFQVCISNTFKLMSTVYEYTDVMICLFD